MQHLGEIPSKRWLLAAVVVLSVCSAGGYLFSADEADPNSAAAGYSEKAKPDPIERNGPIFVDWPKPQYALLFTGEIDGFLEPCGCAGLDNQLGGLKRRHTLIRQLEEQGWPVVPLDLGGFVGRVGPQAEIKFRLAIESLIKLGYKAIALGAPELTLGSDPLLFILANIDPNKSPLVSANLTLFDDDSYSKPFRIIEVGGKRIGVTAVLGRKHAAILANNREVKWTDPLTALQKVVPQLAAEKPDVMVLLVHGDPNEAASLAKQFPEFQLIATTGGAEDPPNQTREIEGAKGRLVEVGQKGKYAIVLGFYDDPQHPIRYQRVPLDHRFQDSPEMQQMLVDYQKELETTGLEGLGVVAVKNPAGEFVGSQVCADCHTQATEIHANTPHAHATQTLVELDPPRHFDPECLSCHATGWNPQKYFPYVSGFLGLEKTPNLTGNGCENCHGPGGAHAAAEGGEEEVDETELERLRAALRLKIVENEGNKTGQVYGKVAIMCMECHDQDNSPDFDFQEYWPQVEHYGKD